MAQPSSSLYIFEGRGRMITHVVGWALFFVLFFFLFNTLRGPWESLTRSGVNLVFMLAIFYGNAQILVNRLLEKSRFSLYLIIVLVVWFLLAVLRAFIEIAFLGGPALRAEQVQFKVSGFSRAFFVYLISFFLVFLFSTLYQLSENRQRLVMRHLALQAQHREAQLNILKSRINPHFLFNTLNNIYAAASLQHPRTPEMVLRLSELLRYVTYETQLDKIAVQKEWAQIQGYVELIRLKSEHTPNIQLHIEDQAPGREIEPVLLLPLVENAFKHGDIDRNEHGFVQIALLNHPEKLVFRVANTFELENTQKDAQGGVGLANVRARLELNYPDHHAFSTEITSTTTPEGTHQDLFVATLTINDYG